MTCFKSFAGAVVAVIVGSTAPASAEIKTATWTGWNGSWNDARYWSGGVVPQNTATDQFVVFIDGGNFLDASVSVVNQTINSLTVDHLDRINVMPLGTFTAEQGIEINGYAAVTDRATMRVGLNQAFTGTGAIEGFYGNNYLQSLGGSLTIGAGLRVGNGAWPESGFMQIGENAYPLINNGTIAALRGSVTALGTVVTNNGTFRTANNGLLQIGGVIEELSDLGTMVNDDGTGVFRFIGTVDNAASTFVLDRTVVGLEIGGLIQGGTVGSTSGHRLNTSSLTLDLDGVTLNAPTTVNGRMRVASGQSLQGNASVLLNNAGAVVDSAGGTFTIGSGISLRGQGKVGGSAEPLVTAASITADQSGAQLLVTGNGITNTGMLRVTNGGILAVGGSFTMSGLGNVVDDGGTLRFVGALDNAGLTFVNGSANTWELGTGGAIVGGTVQTLPGHDLVVVNGATATLNGVTLNGTVKLGSGGNTRLAIPNGIGGDGTILLAGTATTATRIFNPKGNSFDPVVIGDGIVIRGGGGTIGALSTPTLSPPHVTNLGTIQADPGTTIEIIGATLSEGVLVAKEGGRIRSRGNLLLGDGGTVSFDVGGTLSQAVLNITGDIDLSGIDFLQITPLGGAGTNFLIATYTGTRTGEFDWVSPGFEAVYSTPGQIRVVAVPEPATLAGCALAGLALLSRSRRRAAERVRTT